MSDGNFDDLKLFNRWFQYLSNSITGVQLICETSYSCCILYMQSIWINQNKICFLWRRSSIHCQHRGWLKTRTCLFIASIHTSETLHDIKIVVLSPQRYIFIIYNIPCNFSEMMKKPHSNASLFCVHTFYCKQPVDSIELYLHKYQKQI